MCLYRELYTADTFSDFTYLSLVNHPYSSLGGNKVEVQDGYKKGSFSPLSVLISCHFSKTYSFFN